MDWTSFFWGWMSGVLCGAAVVVLGLHIYLIKQDNDWHS